MRTSQASMVTDATEGETYQYEMKTGEEDTHLHYSSRSASEWQSELRSGKRPPWLGGVDVVDRASGGYRTSKGLGSGIARMHTLASRVHTCTSPLRNRLPKKVTGVGKLLVYSKMWRAGKASINPIDVRSKYPPMHVDLLFR